MTGVRVLTPSHCPLLTGRLAAVHVRAAEADKVSVRHIDTALLVICPTLGGVFGRLAALVDDAGVLEEDDVALAVFGVPQVPLGTGDGLAAPDGEDDDDDDTEDDEAA